MNREISHEEAWASLDAAAPDALEPSEREAVPAHASECESCREELETLRAVVSQLALATPSGGTPIEALTRVKAGLGAGAAAVALLIYAAADGLLANSPLLLKLIGR